MAKQSYWTKERKKLQRKAAKALRARKEGARGTTQKAVKPRVAPNHKGGA